jgi:hypothetical protein
MQRVRLADFMYSLNQNKLLLFGRTDLIIYLFLRSNSC